MHSSKKKAYFKNIKGKQTFDEKIRWEHSLKLHLYGHSSLISQTYLYKQDIMGIGVEVKTIVEMMFSGGYNSVSRPAKFYIHYFCADTMSCQEDFPKQ